MRVVVTAGYGRSLHAVGLIHGLAERGHEVVAVLTVRVLDAKRLRAYRRQLGLRRMAHRAWARFFGGRGGDGGLSAEVAPMDAFLREHGFASRTVGHACRAVGAADLAVRGLNDPDCLDRLRGLAPDLVVYAGGGIARKAFLAIPRLGVLNGHGGPLPAFRGMNSAEWSLWYGVRPVVTAMLMDEGIDTGPVLFERPLPAEALRLGRIDHLRGVATRVTVETLLEAVDALADGTATPRPQAAADGRQFFVMAEPMIEVLEGRLKAGRLPACDAKEFGIAQ
jgi:methionyl-tRNA formyltransferase